MDAERETLLSHEGEIIYAYLQYVCDNSFNVGDYLIKVLNSNSYHRAIESFGKTKTPRKYVVTYKDEFGIHFVKRVRKDGSLSKKEIPLMNGDLRYTKYELDPDYADWLLIGEGKYEPYVELNK